MEKIRTILSETVGIFTCSTVALLGRMMKCLLLLCGLGNALVLNAPLRARLARRRSAALAGADLDELEARALAASDAWGVDATEFLPAAEADEAAARLARLTDVAIVGAGGRDGAARRRLVMTRPEIVDAEGEAAIAAAHATLLAVSADLGGSDPIPNVLVGIGIALDDVGDVLVSEDGGEAFIVLAPDVVKTAKRLLGKELAGTVIVTEPEPGAAVPAGKLVEMDVKRLDKRGK